MSYGRPAYNTAFASFEDATAFTRPDFDDADAQWSEPASVELRIAAASPLGQLQAVLSVAPVAHISAISPLGDFSGTFSQPAFLMLAATSVLGMASVVMHHDFGRALGATPVQRYFADLVTPTGVVRVPVMVWQATLQTEDQNEIQCVIPGAAAYIDDITAATEFAISFSTVTPSGVPIEVEWMRAPITGLTLAQGTQNYSATLSGSTDGYADDADPPAAYDRTLTGIRSQFTNSSGLRVRCAVDWLLLPGRRAHVGGTSFVVRYINVYGTDDDAYMDVGELI